MNSKTEILNNLRGKNTPREKHQLSSWRDRDIFSDYPDVDENLLALFKSRLESLSGELFIVSDIKEAITTLLDLVLNVNPEQCKAHHSPLINELKKQSKDLQKFLNYIDEEIIESVEFAKNDIGITQADYLIARTGSILLRTVSAGGRRLSVLPPTHIVIAEENQILPSIDEAFNRLETAGMDWSYATIITGPSRTSDIEKQLVLGAHGPKRLIVILIKDKKSNHKDH